MALWHSAMNNTNSNPMPYLLLEILETKVKTRFPPFGTIKTHMNST